jgi:hypothetical protein
MDAKGFELLMSAKILGEGGGVAMDAEGFERLMAAKILGKGGGGEIKELEGVPPLTFTANGQPLLDYLIYGNAVQTGTPTPENPIMPSGCGEKTENLAFTGWAEDFVTRAATDRAYITQVDGRTCLYAHCTIGYNEYDTKYMFKTDFKESTVYTLIFDYMRPSNLTTSNTIGVLYTDGTIAQLPNYINDGDWHKRTFTTAHGKTVKSICCYYTNGYVYIDINTFMVVEGSTAPSSYIPYGYKLPITLGSTTTNIYLGEVQSARRIKKLVFDGTETLGYNATNHVAYISTPDSFLGEGVSVISTHYAAVSNKTAYQQLSDKQCCLCADINHLWIRDDDYSNVTDFKAFLAAQYDAGTPVTVWYVLAEPETGIVNEPLMKIGDYSDTISMEQAGVNIPTNKGSTTLDVETTIKPSNVYIKYRS